MSTIGLCFVDHEKDPGIQNQGRFVGGEQQWLIRDTSHRRIILTFHI